VLLKQLISLAGPGPTARILARLPEPPLVQEEIVAFEVDLNLISSGSHKRGPHFLKSGGASI
jgi:hypothetical protein